MKELPEKIDSKFRFVLLASHRAEQMMRGAQPKIAPESLKVTQVAMEEIFSERVGWDYGPEILPEEPEPLEVGGDEELALPSAEGSEPV